MFFITIYYVELKTGTIMFNGSQSHHFLKHALENYKKSDTKNTVLKAFIRSTAIILNKLKYFANKCFYQNLLFQIRKWQNYVQRWFVKPFFKT